MLDSSGMIKFFLVGLGTFKSILFFGGSKEREWDKIFTKNKRKITFYGTAEIQISKLSFLLLK